MSAPDALTVAFVGAADGGDVAAAVDAFRRAATSGGAHLVDDPARARLVVNATRTDAPRAHWSRTGLQQFGVSVARVEGAGRPGTSAGDVLSLAYPVLLRTLSNAVIAVDGDGAALVTPELGVRPLRACDAAGAVMPLAGSRFAIGNVVDETLDAGMAARSPRVGELRDGGRRMASLGLLPSVVKLEDVLGPDDLKLLRAVFGLQQISYGNASVREPSGGFWMTARGVDKGRLEEPGRDYVLVTGMDRGSGTVSIRVPRGSTDARASVDALEHALIYEAFDDVGAILHVHAWIDGVDSTLQSWPCGTVELAEEVLELVARQPRPAAAEVGLRNHGLTLTGRDLPSIFARVEGRLRREVPAG